VKRSLKGIEDLKKEEEEEEKENGSEKLA